MFLLPLAPAHALTLCEADVPVDSLPANGAVDVPVDVSPAFVLRPSSCGAEDHTAVLTRADDGVALAMVEDRIHDDGIVEVRPAEPLDPFTAYVLTLDPGGEEAVVAFTTGDGVSAAVEGAPTLTMLSATGFRHGENVEVRAEADAAGEEDSLVVFVEQTTRRARDGHRAPLGAPVEGGWLETDAAGGDVVCAAVLQRTLVGDRLESEVSCVDITRARGCAVNPVRPGVVALLGAMGVFLGRRRGAARR
ncbi:MAG: Ig-like domain-containing protein [Myxococcota bacterium]